MKILATEIMEQLAKEFPNQASNMKVIRHPPPAETRVEVEVYDNELGWCGSQVTLQEPNYPNAAERNEFAQQRLVAELAGYIRAKREAAYSRENPPGRDEDE